MQVFNLHDDIGNDLYIHVPHSLTRLDDYHYPKLKQGGITSTSIVCYFTGQESWNEMKELITLCEKTILDSKHFSFQKNKDIFCFIAVEGMCGIKDNVKEKIQWMHEHHVRVGSLCWNDQNALACGAKSGNSTLTPLGIEAIQAMNDINMAIDVSHCCEKCFYDIVYYSNKPVFATHSNPKGFFDHFRNLDDRQMETLMKQDGIMGILPLKAFLSSSKEKEPMTTFFKALDYVKERIGYKHIALGFDFMDYYEDSIDYVDQNDYMVEGIPTATQIQDMIKAMRKYGYSEKEIKAICYENAKRFLKNYLY